MTRRYSCNLGLPLAVEEMTRLNEPHEKSGRIGLTHLGVWQAYTVAQLHGFVAKDNGGAVFSKGRQLDWRSNLRP